MAKIKKEIQHPRRMPTEGAFMSFKIDDIIYGYLQGIATYNPQENRVYLTEKSFQDAKIVLGDLIGRTARTVSRKIDVLMSEENSLLMFDEEKRQYYFPYDQMKKYCVVSAEILQQLTSVYNKMAVRVYIYLLDKYLWKEKEGNTYDFTIKELKTAFGYSSSTRGSAGTQIEMVLKNILENLKNNHFIDYKDYYDTEHSIHPVPRKLLTFVAQTAEEKGHSFEEEHSVKTPENDYDAYERWWREKYSGQN